MTTPDDDATQPDGGAENADATGSGGMPRSTPPVSAPLLVAGAVVVVGAVLGLASLGSWLAIAGIVVVLATAGAVVVAWSDTW